MVEILYVKVIKLAGSLGKRFHRVPATLLGIVKDCPEPQSHVVNSRLPKFLIAGGLQLVPAFSDTSFLIVVSPWPCSLVNTCYFYFFLF